MPEIARAEYLEELANLEASALGGLDMVNIALGRTMEAVEHQDVELAQVVIADDDRIDGRYLEVHQGILSLMATRHTWPATCASWPRSCMSYTTSSAWATSA